MDNTSPRSCMPGVRILVIAVIAAVVITILAVRLLNFRGADSQAATDGPPRTTTVQLTGTTGAQFTGSYARGRERIVVSGVLPATFSESGVSRWEFRKTNVADTLTLEARDGTSYLNLTAAPGTPGVAANTPAGGWSVESILK
jgi:hypothetical protein